MKVTGIQITAERLGKSQSTWESNWENWRSVVGSGTSGIMHYFACNVGWFE